MNRVLTLPAAVAALSLAGCVPTTASEAPVPASAVRPSPTFSVAGLEAVMGKDARALEARFGSPRLDVREGDARKLQFVGAACVLDAYLYPPGTGAEPVVTHVDARLPDGRDTDRAGCVASLGSRAR